MEYDDETSNLNLYPLTTPVVRAVNVHPLVRPTLERKLRTLVSGFVAFSPMPDDETTCETSAGHHGLTTRTGALYLDSVSNAQKAVATLNHHSAIETLGRFHFCAPGETIFPRMRRMFSTRVIDGYELVDRAAVCPRSEWMDELLDVLANPEPWPVDAPSPEYVYDACVAFGPIFEVRMGHYGLSDDSRWQATVQFFDPSHAAEFAWHVRCRPLCGWGV